MRQKRDLFRLTVNLPTQLVNAVDKYAASVGISRTTALIVLLSDGLAHSGVLDRKDGQ